LKGIVLVKRFKPRQHHPLFIAFCKSIDGFFASLVCLVHRVIQVAAHHINVHLLCSTPFLSAIFMTLSKALSAVNVSIAISAIFISISVRHSISSSVFAPLRRHHQYRFLHVFTMAFFSAAKALSSSLPKFRNAHQFF
jgi:hypothetical protein